MPGQWSTERETCEEFECNKRLSRGHRHHCRECGKSICDTHSLFANNTRFVNKFSNKKKSKVNNFFYKVKSSKRNKRVCLTCAIRYNFMRTPTTKRFSSLTKFDEWLKAHFTVENSYERYDDIMCFKGISFRGDDWKDYDLTKLL